MFKYLLFAALLISVTFAAISEKDLQNFYECVDKIEETCDDPKNPEDYDECKGDEDKDLEDVSGAEFFGAIKDCYGAMADDSEGDCKKHYEGIVECSGSVLGFALALLALVALLI